MSKKLSAVARSSVGKGAARAVRKQGLVPAVIYGDKKPPVSITIKNNEAIKRIHGGGFLSTLIDVDVEGDTIKVIPRDYQLDPVSDKIMHIDFLRIGKGSRITLEIPVNFINEEKCPGLKSGGVLNIVRHTVEINAPADSIPENLVLDLATAEVGDSLHMSKIALPESVHPTIQDRDFTIATIAAPSALRSSDEESDEVSEEEQDDAQEETQEE